MHVWLKALSHPDGDIAMFNDSTLGVAATWPNLEAYRARLGLRETAVRSPRVTYFSESGYVRCELMGVVLIIDVAPVGPDYIPGHAHADTLTFELSLQGRRVMVDTGVSTYEKNQERQRQRGTWAHNTVTVNGQDSSEVWGGFRVARRARPFSLEVDDSGDAIRVACSHDGYRRLPGKPVHRREWILEPNRLTVLDCIQGPFNSAAARFHFHPTVQLVMEHPYRGKGVVQGAKLFEYLVVKGVPRITRTTYHPAFNVSIDNECLETAV